MTRKERPDFPQPSALPSREGYPRELEEERCPVCGEPFVLIIGCRRICACGYMEGCED